MAPFISHAMFIGLAVASPLARSSFSNGAYSSIKRRNETTSTENTESPEDAVDTEDWCENVDLGDEAAVAVVWNDNGVGAYMDEKIAEIGEDDWLKTFANEVFPGQGDTRAHGCSQMGQDCFNEGLDCADMVADSNKEAFWILTAAKNMQNVFETAQNNLLFEGLKATLRVTSIVDDFSLPAEPNPANLLGYISGAFTMLAGAAAFAHPSTRMFAGLAGGAAITASRASVEDPNLIDATSLDSSLETALDACHTALKDSLSLAVGGGGEYNDLPYQQGDYSSAISRFFHDGQFLIQGQPEELFSEGYTWLTRALVAHGLNDAGYTVIGEKDVTESWCTSENVQGTYGARWFSDVEDGRCFKLYMPETRYGYGDQKWRVPDNEVFDKLQNDYGMDIVEFYQAAYDCAKSGNESPDPEDLPSDGSLPTCFYNIPSYQGYNVEMGIDETDYMDTEDWP